MLNGRFTLDRLCFELLAIGQAVHAARVAVRTALVTAMESRADRHVTATEHALCAKGLHDIDSIGYRKGGRQYDFDACTRPDCTFSEQWALEPAPVWDHEA